ncbi:hypothetical protein [Streptomyces sp. NPDC059909]|uniref:hypothetical protein n=1 Tax=Streptomyces sp. NPDC059909 TaxID=3346998 RepID=UPI003659BE62
MRHKAYRPARAAVRAALAAGVLTALAGCSDGGAPAGGPAAPSPRTTSPQELCTTLIAKWGHKLLTDGDSGYGDYQSMGLSNAQYEILRETLDAARAEKQRNGPDSAGTLIDRQSGERCAERYRNGVPTAGPWQ